MFDPHDSMQGGYYNNTTNFDSPSTQQTSKGPANKRDQNVVPVTINQILTSADSGLKIGTQDITLVTICGIITRMQVASMKVTYVISDDTGSIEAHLWVEADDDQNSVPVIVENTYCRVYGSVRTQQGKKHIMIFKIMPLESLNDLTVHMLEIVHANTMAAAVKKVETTNGMNTGDSHLSNSLMSTSYSSNIVSGFNPAQQMVFDVVKRSTDPTGIPRNEVINALKGKLIPKNINDILAFMCGEGHIYTTIDEDHFQCTD